MQSEDDRSFRIKRAIQIILMSFFSLQLLAANYTRFRTEINYGPIPFDVYTMPNIDANGSPYISNCPVPTPSNPTTVRSCIQTLSANYVEGGATGVRFMFAVQGGSLVPEGTAGPSQGSYGASTAWDSEGNVQPAWTNNLNLFLADLKAAGFIYVAPTPMLATAWSGTPYATATVSSCGSAEQLDFYRWLPFGLMSGSDIPDCRNVQDGYNLAARPPAIKNQGFWGWQPYHNLIATVISSTTNAGLLLSEIDLFQEVNLANFTVMGRLIYDNTTNFDVLGDIQSLLSQNGLDPRLATYSVGTANPTQANGDCITGYNDSGMLYGASALQSALAGGGFGLPNGFLATSGLPCGGTAPVSPTFPVTYAVKPLFDIHTYPCIREGNNCSTTEDVTTTATLLYNGITDLAQHYGNSGQLIIIGETTPAGAAGACVGNRSASQNVAGYQASSLPSSGNEIVMRPWSWITNACYPNPMPLSPLYDSGSSTAITPGPLVGSSTVAHGTVSWTVPGSPTVEIHVGSPSGTLFASTSGSGSAVTGSWVTDGMQFFVQDVTNGKPLTLDNTIGIATAHVLPERAALTATPQRINTVDGSDLGVTTLRWSVPPGTCLTSPCVEIHVGSATGPLFVAGGYTGSATTGRWVTDEMAFYLVYANTSNALQTVTVQVSPAVQLLPSKPRVGAEYLGARF
jgi:hypothetical protein